MDTNVLISIISLTIAMLIAGFGCGQLLKARGLLKVSNLSLVVLVAPIFILLIGIYGLFKQPADVLPIAAITPNFLLVTMPLLFFYFYVLVTRLSKDENKITLIKILIEGSIGILGLTLIGSTMILSPAPLWWLIGISGLILGFISRQIGNGLPSLVGSMSFLLMSMISTVILMLTIQSTLFIKVGLYVGIWVLPFIYTHIRTKTVRDKGLWGIPLIWVMVMVAGFFIQIEVILYLYALMIAILMAIMGLKGLESREMRTWWIASVIIQLIWMTQQVFMAHGSLLTWLLAGSLILYQVIFIGYQKRLSVQHFLLASIMMFIHLCIAQYTLWTTEWAQWFSFPHSLYLWGLLSSLLVLLITWFRISHKKSAVVLGSLIICCSLRLGHDAFWITEMRQWFDSPQLYYLWGWISSLLAFVIVMFRLIHRKDTKRDLYVTKHILIQTGFILYTINRIFYSQLLGWILYVCVCLLGLFIYLYRDHLIIYWNTICRAPRNIARLRIPVTKADFIIRVGQLCCLLSILTLSLFVLHPKLTLIEVNSDEYPYVEDSFRYIDKDYQWIHVFPNQMPGFSLLGSLFTNIRFSVTDQLIQMRRISIIIYTLGHLLVWLIFNYYFSWIIASIFIYFSFIDLEFLSSLALVENLYFSLCLICFLVINQFLKQATIKKGFYLGVLLAITYLLKASILFSLLSFIIVYISSILYRLTKETAFKQKDSYLKANQRIKPLLICVIVFLLILSPKLRTATINYGTPFFNVNTNHHMWYESWGEAKAEWIQNYGHEVPVTIDKKPFFGFIGYLKTHGVISTFNRFKTGVAVKLRQLAEGTLKWAGCLAFILSPFLFYSRLGINRKQLAFSLVFFGGYLCLYGFYGPVSEGRRFTYMLYQPLGFVFTLLIYHGYLGLLTWYHTYVKNRNRLR